MFELPTVNYDLFENAIVVKYGKTARGVTAGSERIHISGGKTSETAVSESRVGLECVNLFHIYAKTFNRFGYFVGDAEVEKMVAKRSAEKKFHRHIIHLLCVLLVANFLEVDSLVGEQISYRHTSCAINLIFARIFGFNTEVAGENGRDVGFDFFLGNV